MEILTPRLRLRRAVEADLDALHAVFSDPRAMRYWSTPPHASREETRLWLTSMIGSPPGLSEDFIVEHQGRVIGKAGFWRLPEIGYILHPDAWGQGLAFEALSAVIDHVVVAHPDLRLIADVDPRNTGSLRLLKKLGFHRTGAAERTFLVGGVWCDSVYFARDHEVPA
jgi:ribosomal-protein-alanine N-acetyltransferase